MLLQSSSYPVIPRKILVTGGAGYIGSHTVRLLLQQGHDVTVVDNLSRGYRHNVPAGRLHEISLADTAALTGLIKAKQCDAVIHFAAFIAVGESKVMVKPLLRWFDQIHGLTSVSLRYFNASGADPEGALGEEHEPETHLIPLVLRAVRTGEPITVFGADYATPDGTCIRDYIHVYDLAQAHILAVEYLLNGGPSDQFNVGTGAGSSVLEIIRTVEEVTGKKVPYVVGPRREGDPSALVASSQKLRGRLGWSPQYADLRTIVAHAWNFANR